MPFIAELNGDLVTPVTVTKDDTVMCPLCDTEMTVRESHERNNETFVASHFVHISEEAECPGESKPHMEMKSIAAAKLKNEYPESTVELEEPIGDKQPDVRVSFPETKPPLGNGIAVEIQYRNYSKNREKTTSYYLSRDYSVLWLTQNDFQGKNVYLDNIIPVWPNVIQHAKAEEYYPSIDTTKEKVHKKIPVPEQAQQITAKQRQTLRWHWLIGRVNYYREKSHTQQVEGEWNEVVSTKIEQYGRIKMLSPPDNAHVIQFEKENASYEDASMGIKLAYPKDLTTIANFLLQVDKRFNNAQRAEGVGEWKKITQKRIGYGRSNPKFIVFSLDPSGTPAVKLHKKDPTIPDIPLRLHNEKELDNLFDFYAEAVAVTNPKHVIQLTNHITK